MSSKIPQLDLPNDLPVHPKGRRAPRPKLASTIVLLRTDQRQPQILMGKRSAKHDFMPSVYVFPGGRVDPADSYAHASDHMNSRTRNILEAAMSPARAKACVMASVRETFEETSLILGQKQDQGAVSKRGAINDPSWRAFYESGYVPVLEDIEVFGRAITPPHRHKRFDTWFFLARLDEQTANRPFQNSAELIDTHWFSFEQIKELELHRATQMMVGQLETYLDIDNPPADVFYSRMVRKKYTFGRFP